MKRTMQLLLTTIMIMALAGAAFAQEETKEKTLSLSGEAKTGIDWERSQLQGDPSNDELTMHSRDDAGGGMGRFRLNMDYDNGNNFGFKSRVQWENWNNDRNVLWQYAFGYGNFFDNQMTVSVGKLGGSPWGTGGPEMWKELEDNNSGGGMRVEYKPAFIPEEYGKLNVGFVLNYFNSDRDQGMADIKITLAELLKESIIGISYTHDYFLARFAYRFDSDIDAFQDNKFLENGGKGEDEIVYRLEEHALKDFLPGMQMWALGHFVGLSATNKEIQWFRNWLFAEYNPPELWGITTPFTAQLRFGLNHIDNRDEFLFKPSFYWHFFNKLLSVGTAFSYCQDFGNKLTEGSPYQYIELTPKIQLNFTSSYIAFEYCFRKEYIGEAHAVEGYDPIKQTTWMNLRFCIYF